MFSVFSVKPLRVALLCGASLSALHTVPVQAGDTASIKVSATIVNRTCTPVWKGEQTVDFKTVDMVANPVKYQDFTLSLTGCHDVTKVNVTASGTPDDTLTTAFKNMSADSPATSVAVSLYGGPEQQQLMQPSGSGTGVYPVTGGQVDMTFKAKLQTTGSAVTSGNFSAPITLKMDYE